MGGELAITKIYIILTANDTFLSKCIQCYTKTPYNHASLSLESSLKSVYSFGRKKYWNPFIGGFVKEDFYHQYYLHSSCQIYELSVSLPQFNHLKKILDQFKYKKNYYKYNWRGLLSLPFKKDWGLENAFFCSQFIAYLISEVGINLLTKPNYLVTPMDLAFSLKPKLVYEGQITNYLVERRTSLYIPPHQLKLKKF